MTTVITPPSTPQSGTDEYRIWIAQRNRLIKILYEQNFSVRSIASELTKCGYSSISSARVYEIIKKMIKTGIVLRKRRYGQANKD